MKRMTAVILASTAILGTTIPTATATTNKRPIDSWAKFDTFGNCGQNFVYSSPQFIAASQVVLKSQGYYPPAKVIDGIITGDYIISIKAFQKANNLVPDGCVGPKTWNALKTKLVKTRKIVTDEGVEQGKEWYKITKTYYSVKFYNSRNSVTSPELFVLQDVHSSDDNSDILNWSVKSSPTISKTVNRTGNKVKYVFSPALSKYGRFFIDSFPLE